VADGDPVTGARLSKGGKSIVSLASKSLQGRSNVVFALPLGTGVSITRVVVEYVVTEYGRYRILSPHQGGGRRPAP